jgi:hypothetical protein
MGKRVRENGELVGVPPLMEDPPAAGELPALRAPPVAGWPEPVAGAATEAALAAEAAKAELRDRLEREGTDRVARGGALRFVGEGPLVAAGKAREAEASADTVNSLRGWTSTVTPLAKTTAGWSWLGRSGAAGVAPGGSEGASGLGGGIS